MVHRLMYEGKFLKLISHFKPSESKGIVEIFKKKLGKNGWRLFFICNSLCVCVLDIEKVRDSEKMRERERERATNTSSG